MSDRKRVAAIITVYRPRSHADVLVGKFIQGFPTDGGLLPPRVEIASMYIDQFPDEDIGRAMEKDHGIPIYESIVKALTLGGSDLAVDGVLLIGEHGDYAWNEKEQHLFPRKYFMEQICGVLATSGRSVPVFNDKHLSYNWRDAKWMVDRAAGLNAPFMAGSSIPVACRDPWLEHKPDAPIEDAVAIGYSGLDIYGFHTLEGLQCMVERRKGGETGVAAVTCLEGKAVWAAAKDGLWSKELAERACDGIENKPDGPMEDNCENPSVFLVEYRDGFRACALMLNGYVKELAYAAREAGESHATVYRMSGGAPHAHFSYLGLNIEEMFVTGVPSYPVARTLLTSGILEAALDSRHQGHKRLPTPHLDVSYRCDRTAPWISKNPRPSGASLAPLPSSLAYDDREKTKS